MIIGLAARLDALAAQGQTASYGALARDLELSGAGSIARLTTALEVLMAEDAAAGRPFRAALCEGRLSGGLPAQGFFVAAGRLGRFTASDDPVAFVAVERARLFNRPQAG